MQSVSPDEGPPRGPAYHPYRPVPYEEEVKRPRRGSVMAARPRELLAVLGLVAVADFAVWRSNDFGDGGIGSGSHASTPLATTPFP